MASRLNSEFNYRTQVIGETPWEKISTLKGFIEGRKRALALREVQSLKTRAKKSKLKHLQENGPEWEALELEAEILEEESSAEDAAHAFKLAKEELDSLYRYLDELYEIAEPTRIPGKTDDEMFELNAENEFATWVVREIQAEIVANGRPSPAKLRNAMSSKLALNGLKSIGVLPPEFQVLTGHNDIKYLLENGDNFLLTDSLENNISLENNNSKE